MKETMKHIKRKQTRTKNQKAMKTIRQAITN